MPLLSVRRLVAGTTGTLLLLITPSYSQLMPHFLVLRRCSILQIPSLVHEAQPSLLTILLRLNSLTL